MGFLSRFTNHRSILVCELAKISDVLIEFFSYRAQCNILIGFILLAWIITPIAYYSNLWNSKAMPIVSNRVFNTEGYFYNVSAVLTSDLRLNETAYKQYGNIYRSLEMNQIDDRTI